ncbi:rod shape-determining protein MreD [Carbonactinospora thermoautotrophica]|uniref:Rod shape-determining protein MreD n=1 Tax=Carbonactinospora thermoautotrophica TaxID=1469144 RepID=A0A132MXC9_9ACTN|nr:rod shape-determining protein MreD [Carbonactinospora thermoautotrophica]KWX02022.1 Rod shape-determining protein MreD [Carbonactinospora thermoautotrophica]MCX9189952.1 rod shape-determining protein MreD [Carbonactinospora thermoautotrophica]
MSGLRVVYVCGLVVAALTLQLTLLSRLGLPGATPDLLLVVVVALALVYGPRAGALVGFGAGLAADLVPPADHAIGRFAFVLCLIGYLAGAVRTEAARSAVGSMVVIGLAAVGAALVGAGLAEVLGEAHGVGAVLGLIPTAVLYDVLLAPFVVPAVTALARRIDPDTLTW